MENKVFNVSQDVMLRLLKKDEEAFIAKFGQGYGLQTRDILWLALELISDEKGRKKFLMEMPFDEDDFDIISILDEFYPRDVVDEMLINKGYTRLLKKYNYSFSDRPKRLVNLIKKGKLLDEIYASCEKDYQSGRYSHYDAFSEFISTERFDIFEKHENWKVLALTYHETCAQILLKHKRYQEMLSFGTSRCYGLLYNNGLREMMKNYLLSLSEEDLESVKRRVNLDYFFRNKKEWAILSEGLLYQCASRDYLWFLLFYREKIKKDTKDIWAYCSKDKYIFWDSFGNFWRGEEWDNVSKKKRHENLMSKSFETVIHPFPSYYCSLEAFQIWIYKNIENQMLKKRLLKSHFRFSKTYRKMKDPDFPTRLVEIEKALNF